jgi:hypothetical protein
LELSSSITIFALTREHLTMAEPIYSFSDPAEFIYIHSEGTNIEFKYEKKKIEAFNDQKHKFRAWCIRSLGNDLTTGHHYWLYLVAPGDKID